jgi:SAM-dependent methyltransferase
MPAVSATTARKEVFCYDAAASEFAPLASAIVLRCPVCSSDGNARPYESLAAESNLVECQACSCKISQDRGIWKTLLPVRQEYFARFMGEYEQVRKAEGRGSTAADFYLALPFRDITGKNAWQWSIRARTYAYLVRKILPGLRRKARSTSLKILDLGAGNGWLSHRLSRLGHRPVAVDLLTNEFDGLGAAVHYKSAVPKGFPRFQAELDHLPFADEQFDCAIFNASFHYSENYESTLLEAMRCISPGGTIVIADSPTYSNDAAGRRMVEERQEFFQKNFGFKSNGVRSSEYLTPERLLALAARHRFAWRTHRVWYGWRWASRPLFSRLEKRREPSQFCIYTARVKEQ